MPFFSIIIPLYNKETFIQGTLKSVLNQSFQDFEVLIIDDGSTDKSLEKVKSVSDRKIRIFEQENKGVSEARNKGIKEAKANHIAFLDADDYWYPHFLEEMHKHIQILPQQKAFACAIEFQIKDKIIPSVYSIEKKENHQIVNYFESSLRQSVLWTSSSVFEKSVFEKSGVFNVNYKAGEDTDLWVRIGLNYLVVFIWKIGARYVSDKGGLSLNRNKIDSKASFEEYLELERDNKPLKKFLDYNRFSLAVESKIVKDNKSFLRFRNHIDENNLPLKKRILLKTPRFILLFLIWVKKQLALAGIGKSVFKI